MGLLELGIRFCKQKDKILLQPDKHHLLQVFNEILSSSKAIAAPILPAMLASMTSALEHHRHVSCLKTLGTAVEVFGSSAAEVHLISTAFTKACDAILPHLAVCAYYFRSG
jgi:hypothetical protein